MLSSLLLIAITQSLILGFILIFFSGKRRIDSILLGLLLILIGYDLFEAYCYSQRDLLPALPDLSGPLLFIYGPLIFYYTLSFLRKSISLKSTVFISVSVIVLGTAAEISDVIALYYIGYAHVLFFIFISLNKSRKNRQLFILLFMLLMISSLSVLFSITNLPLYLFILILLSYLLLVFRLTYLTMTNTRFSLTAPPSGSYANYRQGKKRDQEQYKRLLDYIKNHTPFLDPDLTPAILADSLEVKEQYLSYLLNQLHGMSFYTFINNRRVEHAKMLLNISSLTITEIIYQSGFNSKSTFNKTFKEETGLTPSQFRKKMSDSP